MTADKLTAFLAKALQADLCEGAANALKLTYVHHHDEQPAITVETMNGERLTVVTVKTKWR